MRQLKYWNRKCCMCWLCQSLVATGLIALAGSYWLNSVSTKRFDKIRDICQNGTINRLKREILFLEFNAVVRGQFLRMSSTKFS